jgi:HK97 family phage major capsid protein
MPATHLDTLVEKRQQITDHFATLTGSDDFDPDSAELRELQEQAERLDAQIKQVQAAAEMRASGDAIAKRIGTAPDKVMKDTGNIGRALVDSRGFQAWKRAGATGRAKLMDLDVRALITTGEFPSTPDRVVAARQAQQTTLLSSINRQMVSTNSVEVIKYPSADPVAGDVPEGQLKPEAAFTITVETVNLITQAHWAEFTRQVAEDEPRFIDFINNSLLRGVYDKAEANAIAAVEGGTGYQTATGATMLESIRVGVALVNSAGFRPTVVLMNPLDAASLDYEVYVDSLGATAGQGAVWGVPVVPNGGIAEGTAYVADAMAAWHHYYRGTAELFVSDSDVGIDGVSNFKRNILTALGEYRSVTHVVRPEAVAECTVAAPPLAAAKKAGGK